MTSSWPSGPFPDDRAQLSCPCKSPMENRNGRRPQPQRTLIRKCPQTYVIQKESQRPQPASAYAKHAVTLPINEGGRLGQLRYGIGAADRNRISACCKDDFAAPNMLLRSASIRKDPLTPKAIFRRDVHHNSCFHIESLNCFERFGNRPNESDQAG